MEEGVNEPGRQRRQLPVAAEHAAELTARVERHLVSPRERPRLRLRRTVISRPDAPLGRRLIVEKLLYNSCSFCNMNISRMSTCVY